MWKGCATASSIRSALFAAQLAAEGMTGPNNPFEGAKGLWEQSGVTGPVILDRFGGGDTPFRINETTFKYYPSQIHTQSPVGLALELRQRVDLSQIDSISIKSYRSAVSSPATEPEKWSPKTRETADHSIPYTVAVALIDGAITPQSFTAERISDPALRILLDKMTMTEDPDFTRRYSQEYNCRIEIKDKSGQSAVAETSFPKGHRHNPLSDAELSAKFRGLARPTITDQQCAEALDLLWRLEDLPNLQGVYDSLIV
jgi:2-methylcitrate dehydratase